MTLRINLLRNDELRESGALSQGFIMRLGVIIVVVGICIFAGLVVLNSKNVKQNLKQTRARFRKVDAVYQDTKVMQEDLVANKRLLEELGTLADARLSWAETLLSLQEIVPENMQLIRLSAKEAYILVKGAKKGENIPSRRFTMRLDGRITGEIADPIAIRFVRDLRSSEQFEPIMDSVQLTGQGLKRDAKGKGGGVDRWAFGIEAVGTPRKMKMSPPPKAKKKKKK